MKHIKTIAAGIVCTLLAGCSNFEDINTNPDTPTNVNSSLLATGAIHGILAPSSSGKTFVTHMFITKYLGWGEGAVDGQYNDFGRASFSDYAYLQDYKNMAELAPESNKSAYEGLAALLKAYVLFNHTLEVGDIPYSQILQGEEGLLTPVYDTQKDVCLGVLEDLQEAYSKLSAAQDFSGDIVFGGSARQWAKVATALQLRVLINLSKREDDADLNVAQRFREAYQNGLLMESNEDNLQLAFSDKAGQYYPYNSSTNRHWAYAMLSDFLVKLLKDNQDYRLFYYGRPAQTQLDAGVAAASWDAFVGVDPTAPISEVKDHYAAGDCSRLNPRYVDYISGEPYIQLGYAEQCFILAEAALRGWISADASQLYKQGIRASMEFIYDHTPDSETYHYGHPLTDTYIDSFLEQSSVQLSGSFDEQLCKIMEQKYIAAFMQLPYQPYYDYRRTGYPVLPVNPETSQNFNAPDKLPMRWQYPDVEISYNTENVETAIQRQYGSDEVNGVMWILQ